MLLAASVRLRFVLSAQDSVEGAYSYKQLLTCHVAAQLIRIVLVQVARRRRQQASWVSV